MKEGENLEILNYYWELKGTKRQIYFYIHRQPRDKG